MGDAHDQDQKTEQPTEKKLSEAHDRGEFAKSPELTLVFMLAAILGVLGFTTRTASQYTTSTASAISTGRSRRRRPPHPRRHRPLCLRSPV